MGELAAICYVDLCRAATYVSKDGMEAYRELVPDIENELSEKLLNKHRVVDNEQHSNNIGVFIDHRCLIADYIVAMFRLDPNKTVRTIIPTCFDRNAPTLFKMSVVKAAFEIASENNRLPWVSSISALYTPLCSRIRNLFLDFFSRDIRDRSDTSSLSLSSIQRKTLINGSTSDKKGKKDTRSLSNECYELILDVLRLYQIDPKLAVMVCNGRDLLLFVLLAYHDLSFAFFVKREMKWIDPHKMQLLWLQSRIV